MRQVLVFVHVAVSVGWMGAGAANVVLAMTAGYTGDRDVVFCLATKWGLVRYWWVAAKLALTVGVVLYSTFGLGVWVEESVVAAGRGVESPVAGPLAYGAALNIAAFLFMTWLSVAKPWGKTPWARPPAARAVQLAGR